VQPSVAIVKLSFKRALSVSPLSITLAVIVVSVALFSSRIPILDQFELRTYDLRFLWRGARPPSPAIALAMIDEKSLDAEGRWPWPRSKIASLVERLSRDGAKVIAFDIGFLEPDQHSQASMLERIERAVHELGVANPGLDAFLQESRRDADNDAALERAIRESSAAVVVGYFFHMSEKELEYQLPPREIARQTTLLARSKYPLVLSRGDGAALQTAYAPEGNIEPIAKAAASSGYFSVQQDPDGVVRWMPMVIKQGADLFPPLSILAAWHYLDRPQMMVQIGPYGVEAVRMGERTIPTDETGRLLIDYVGPPKTFPHFSVTDILTGRVPEGTFRGRLVVVGAAATGIYDVRSTPFSPVTPGTEIQATVIDNILTDRFITKPAWTRIYDIFAIIALAGLVGLVLPHLGALSGLLFAALLFVLHISVARELFTRSGVWLNIVYPLLALTTTYIGLTVNQYVREQRERAKIRNTFGRYVAPVVVETMLKDPSRLQLGGEQKVLTVLFSDLQGFTANSERLGPQKMIELLSEYYARMTERIFAHEGMLKEYVGDELMAIFGAPVEHADHAVRACAAALEMRAHREALNVEWEKIGRPAMRARTGVNSGLMLVGNLGSEYRFAYGVLGDNVNLGSRLEGLNKEYGTDILVGENTIQLVGDAFHLREIDLVRVVGKKEPTRVYELLGASAVPLTREWRSCVERYTEALAAYREQRWSAAISGFDGVLEAVPTDGAAKTMLARCQQYQSAPPADGWDGVYELTRK